MTDLKKLKVSLTKNGFHKIWLLISQLDLMDISNSTKDVLEGVNLNKAQVLNILSASKSGTIPDFWNQVKAEGSKELIQKLVFLSIIFSHHNLINALSLSKSSENNGTGTLERDRFLIKKVYTNFIYAMSEFGLLTTQVHEYVNYDFQPIFSDELVSKYAPEIFRLKLIAAGWDGASDLVDECVENKFHEALALNENDFRDWMNNKIIQGISEEVVEVEDESLDNETNIQFNFSAGHNKTKLSSTRTTKAKKAVVSLEHKRIQDHMYIQLSEEFGSNVSTENATGFGTSIDVVVDRGNADYVFYELKTDSNIKSCVRQALSQLMEYSYWGDKQLASELVIVSPNRVTDGVRIYLKSLREKFNIPIYYQHFDLTTNRLGEKV